MSWHCEIRKDREAIISPKVRPGRTLWSVRAAHVRFGSGTDVAASLINVRFTPESGHRNSLAGCPLCAKSGHCDAKLVRCTLAIPGRRAADGQTDEPPCSVVSTSRGDRPAEERLHHAAIGAMRALRGSNRRFALDFG